MLGDIQRTHLDLLAVQSGLMGRLHVGTGLPRVLLPNTIARLQQSHVGYFVSVTESPLPELLDLLAHREIDVVIGALSAQALASGFTCEPLLADSVQIAVRTGHPLLQQTKPEWHETLAYPWLLPPTGSVMRGVLETAFTAQGLQAPMPVVEANSSIRMQLLSGEQPYVSILSKAELQIYRPLGSLKIVPLNPVIALPDIGAIWESARLTPLLSRFLDALRLESREQADWT
jgi:DNA-binding transcriptional LysR family regulator